MWNLMRRYAWADDPALDLTWCVSVVEGMSMASVVEAFGGARGTARKAAFRETEAEAGAHFGEFTNLVVIPHDQHIVTIDSYGYSGIVPETARRASKVGGRYFSFHHDMSGNARIP